MLAKGIITAVGHAMLSGHWTGARDKDVVWSLDESLEIGYSLVTSGSIGDHSRSDLFS